MDTKTTTAVVLAAGKGTRMKSPIPKVLHPVAGRPMIERVIRNLHAVGVSDIRVIVGHGQKWVRAHVEPLGVHCFLQEEQRGTAHAVRCGNLQTAGDEVLIVNGDHPLIQPEDFEQLFDRYAAEKLDLAVVSSILKKPGKFGRIVRHFEKLNAIVEAKDASAETLKIAEVNTGLYLVDTDLLNSGLEQISSENAAGEFYLTDLVAVADSQGAKLDAIRAHRRVAFGVNTQMELAAANRAAFYKNALSCMERGTIIVDPRNCYIEDSVTLGEGTVIGPNVHLRGKTECSTRVVIEAGSLITDSQIGAGSVIKPYSCLEQVEVGEDCQLGPYLHLKPGTSVPSQSTLEISEAPQASRDAEVLNS